MIGGTEIISNTVLLALCYVYIIAMIFISIKIGDRLPATLRRKFLHIMIGNFVFIIPFFTLTIFPLNFPFFVAFPFVVITFLVTPASPLKLTSKISGLSDITISGHEYGLLFYAISYTILAFFYSATPYIIIAGILPMSFGDAAASLVGQKIGHHKISIRTNKSFEGSAAMFLTTLISVTFTLFGFSYLWSFSLTALFLSSLVVALLATALEALTPKGLDNLTVPLICALVFLVLVRGL